MRPLRIVQINTSDLGGGAAKTAWKLHQAFAEKGHSSVLCVGRKLSNDPNVIEIDNSQRGRGASGRLKAELEWRFGRRLGGRRRHRRNGRGIHAGTRRRKRRDGRKCWHRRRRRDR